MLAKLLIIETKSTLQSFAYDESGTLIYHLNEDGKADLEVIYKARINSVNKKSKLAYVDYAPNLQGIVNLKNTNVQAGSDLLCQLVWQGDQNKLPKLSVDVKLLGKYVIILPNTTQHFFSKQLKTPLITELSNKYQNIGMIFRSSIDTVFDYSLVENEINFLIKQADALKHWQEKPTGPLTLPCYKFMQLLREAKLSLSIEIYTNSEAIFDYLTPYLDLWQLNAINLDESLIASPIDELPKNHVEFGLEIHKLSGINLIDINSKNAPLNFYQVNYLAVDEIVRQIWLQDLTGIILLDFIKNMSVEENHKLLTKLNGY
ncbi:MAG TPA: ribonuclease E/G, partial [Aquella sp.]|nr:ribonuclease E/G [Aquella sp.]